MWTPDPPGSGVCVVKAGPFHWVLQAVHIDARPPKNNCMINTENHREEAHKPRIAILGFGNPVREDDGAGIHVIELLQQTLGDHPDVAIYDMGTGAFELLYRLQDHERIIIVDAVVNSGEPPGTVFRLPAEAIEAQIQDDPMVFLHQLKWDQALSYTKKMLGDAFGQKDISVFLIAIDHTRFNLEMSEAVRAGCRKAADAIIETLQIGV